MPHDIYLSRIQDK